MRTDGLRDILEHPHGLQLGANFSRQFDFSILHDTSIGDTTNRLLLVTAEEKLHANCVLLPIRLRLLLTRLTSTYECVLLLLLLEVKVDRDFGDIAVASRRLFRGESTWHG